MGKVIANFSVHSVRELPAHDASFAGQFRRTIDGLFYSDGEQWVRIDAPGVFTPITESDYNNLDPEDQDDPAVMWVWVTDANNMRPTRTWVEVSEEPISPTPNTLYVLVED